LPEQPVFDLIRNPIKKGIYAILDEHPEWSKRLIAERARRPPWMPARGSRSRGMMPPDDVVAQAIALTRAASIDVGGVEYLVSARDGLPYFYDIDATSNFVADAPRVLGFDPFPAFGDYIIRVAGGGAVRAAA
jgi:hypothetical protein